jgi:hypothetical protein
MGMQYAQRGYQSKWHEPEPWEQSVTGAFPSSDFSVLHKYYYNFIDLPLKLEYFFEKKRKIRIIGAAGLSPSIPLNTHTITVIRHVSGLKVKDKTMYTGRTGMGGLADLLLIVNSGAEMDLGKRCCVRLEPTFRYSLLWVRYFPIHQHLWSLGLNASCLFRL